MWIWNVTSTPFFNPPKVLKSLNHSLFPLCQESVPLSDFDLSYVYIQLRMLNKPLKDVKNYNSSKVNPPQRIAYWCIQLIWVVFMKNKSKNGIHTIRMHQFMFIQSEWGLGSVASLCFLESHGRQIFKGTIRKTNKIRRLAQPPNFRLNVTTCKLMCRYWIHRQTLNSSLIQVY